MSPVNVLVVLLSSIALTTATGCKDKEEVTPTPVSSVAPVAAASDAAPAPATKAPEVPASGDFFRVEVWHTVPKPEDPIVVSFPVVKILRASFDPTELEGASASLEIEVGALLSGNKKRDVHLKDPDFFEIEKFPRGTISISEVKKKSDKTYQARAEVVVHGETAVWPVEFTVVGSTSNSITVEASHKFDRNEFKVGDADTKSIVGQVEAHLRVTLHPTP